MAIDVIAISPSEWLELSGENYTSAAGGEGKHERYHRYFFALQFCDKKDVLVVGSGEGYGSALLGLVAQRVYGVDQLPEVVARASRNYGSARVSFRVGDYAAIPLSDASVDVVVSFETLEHVTHREKFFCEIKRALRADGMLVISMCNAKVGKDVGGSPNGSQVKELDRAELCAILSEHFCNYRVLGQGSVVGSAIVADPDSDVLSGAVRQQTFRAADSGVYSAQEGIGSPATLIAVASETVLPEIRHGLLDDRPFLEFDCPIPLATPISLLFGLRCLRNQGYKNPAVAFHRVLQIVGQIPTWSQPLPIVPDRAPLLLQRLAQRTSFRFVLSSRS